MTLKEFLEKYCSKHQVISVSVIEDNGIRTTIMHWEHVDDFLDDEFNSALFDREVIDIFCGHGEVLYINVKGE